MTNQEPLRRYADLRSGADSVILTLRTANDGFAVAPVANLLRRQTRDHGPCLSNAVNRILGNRPAGRVMTTAVSRIFASVHLLSRTIS